MRPKADEQTRVLNIVFDDGVGGPQRRIIIVANALRRHGVETILCLPDRDGNAAEFAAENGVEFRRLSFARNPHPRKPLQTLKWLIELPRDVWRFGRLYREERPDLVHINSAFFLAPALAAWLAGVPLVWHLNDVIAPRGVSWLLGRAVRWFADRVVVSAWAVAVHYSLRRDSVELLYPPVNLELANGLPGRTRRADHSPYRIGIVANWNPYKGLEYFLKAASILKVQLDDNLEVVLAGKRLNSYQDYGVQIDALVRKLELTEIVHNHGYVADVSGLISGLDVLISSAVSEAFGMSVTEAMALGVPVVAAAVGGVSESVMADPERPAGILVPPRDPQAIAEAVLRLQSKPEYAAEMGRNGRALAEERFSLKICAERHLEVYKAVTNESEVGREFSSGHFRP